MAAAGTATAVSMKLFVETRTQRVAVAMASTEVFDLLRSLLASPHEPLDFGAMTVDGCIANLYDSLDVLDAAARSPGPRHHHCPCGCDCDDCSPPADAAAQQAAQAANTKRFYGCRSRQGAGCGGYVTEARGASCPSCGGEMAMEVPLGSPGAGCSTGGAAYTAGGGAAGGTWALLDNLTVLPLPASQPTVAAMLNLLPTVFGCISHGPALREETVSVGFNQGMQILKTSLRSSTVLIEVFIRGKVPCPA
ncbi:hypothetical protein U9M48_020783 [Paspalum notatum var. saurae]|uniref:Uncharacterized protein n=1 Tax=Paspalum notatum var. saurae TaxID=547442 RepID=A0AAQ3WS30_PASNO